MTRASYTPQVGQKDDSFFDPGGRRGTSIGTGTGVIGTVKKMKRDLMVNEQKPGKFKPGEYPATRSEHDKQNGIARTKVAHGRGRTVTRLERTEAMGDEPLTGTPVMPYTRNRRVPTEGLRPLPAVKHDPTTAAILRAATAHRR